MSAKSKLIDNNQKLNSTNKNLLAIKNAFLKPLSDVPITTQEKSVIPTTSIQEIIPEIGKYLSKRR